jgi:rhodanese-related sulfurtransferase/uncharacterized membrane protein YedE/YeeE
MNPFPLPLVSALGPVGAYLIYVLIGFGFGFVLEQAGFAKSTKLAGQFYFKDMTVIKVMFGAIVVAMILLFLASGLGLLDMSKVWVNPTYLWPGIVGGLIMGVGFILGGFCPGTSLVAASTGKIDGIFFLLGAFFGIFLFGETVSSFEAFYHSSNFGRLMIPDWLGVDTGVVVFVITIMALFVFFGSEQLEKLIGKRDLKKEPKWRLPAAGGLIALAVVVLAVGQPTAEAKWARMAEEKTKLLTERAVQVQHGEVLSLLANDRVRVRIFDLRSESDYNQFHLLGAEHVRLEDLPAMLPTLRLAPENTVFFLMSADEKAATDAWKYLTAEGLPTVYIIEGGANQWLDQFGDEEFRKNHAIPFQGEDKMRYHFPAALGARYPASNPSAEEFKLEFTPKVKLATKGGPKGGGCG